MLETSKGKKAVQLETVGESEQGVRNDLTYGHDVLMSDSDAKQKSRLTAINRAPPIVAELYRRGLINQVDAAALGKLANTTLGEATAAAKKAVEDAKANPLAEESGGAPIGNKNAQKEKAENNVDNIKVVSGGTSSEYTLRRLARDGHNELLDQIANGETTAGQKHICRQFRI